MIITKHTPNYMRVFVFLSLTHARTHDEFSQTVVGGPYYKIRVKSIYLYMCICVHLSLCHNEFPEFSPEVM